MLRNFRPGLSDIASLLTSTVHGLLGLFFDGGLMPGWPYERGGTVEVSILQSKSTLPRFYLHLIPWKIIYLQLLPIQLLFDLHHQQRVILL